MPPTPSCSPSNASARRLRACLVGTGGYARVHLDHLNELSQRGEIEFVAVVSPPGEAPGDMTEILRQAGVECFTDFGTLVAQLPRLKLDLAFLPTPIHLHASMTEALVSAGVHVLVEKPLCARASDGRRLAELARTAGRSVAVGFQYLHAPEVQALSNLLLQGHVGRLRRIWFLGSWPRGHAYYQRNNWAGRLQLDGEPVLDSPYNNAMSHFVMVMLLLGGVLDGTRQLARFRAELLRAQAIESFDTGIVQLECSDGLRIDFHGSHSTSDVRRPMIVVEGERGTAQWVQDVEASISAGSFSWRQVALTEAAVRERMILSLAARVRGEPGPVCTIEDALQHVRIVEQLHAHFPIRDFPAGARVTDQSAEGPFTRVPGLEGRLEAAARAGGFLQAEKSPEWASLGA